MALRMVNNQYICNVFYELHASKKVLRYRHHASNWIENSILYQMASVDFSTPKENVSIWLYTLLSVLCSKNVVVGHHILYHWIQNSILHMMMWMIKCREILLCTAIPMFFVSTMILLSHHIYIKIFGIWYSIWWDKLLIHK